MEAYAQEIDELLGEIVKRLEFMGQSTHQSDATTVIRALEDLFAQADDVIKSWEMDVRQLVKDNPERPILLDLVAKNKTSLTQKRAEFARAKNASQRSSLIGEQSMRDREKMLDAQERMAMQTRKIEAATRSIYETEEVGAEVLAALGENRAKIESSQSKSKELYGEMEKAERLTKSMQNRDKCVVQ